MKNIYCESSDLSNEASVESFFVLRLLQDLGYTDREVKTKQSIEELRVPKGRKRELYKPDFLLVCANKPRWLIEAKATTERIEDWTYQCAGYALLANRKYTDSPVRYYLVTTGLLTRVYVWDQEEAVLSLRFTDFKADNPKYEALKKLLGAPAARAGWQEESVPAGGLRLRRPSIEEVKRAFLRCHRVIWKAEKLSPQAAFVGFAKLLFVKLWEDRRLRDDATLLARISAGQPLPPGAVRFSTRWVDEQTAHTPNPIDSILFQQLVQQLEQEIARKRRKRIFERGETLGLSPGTVKRVVEALQGYYLFGIDEDLNGRMFETFLTATMRGQDLGQFFTPRSIVKLIVYLANPQAGRDGIERVLDACCGTGGFLIEALTEMRKRIYENTSLTKSERDELLNEVANEAIVGIDAGREPPLARIARINMYLHGDGGSRIYRTDALQHPPACAPDESVEVKEEVAELASLVRNGSHFDVVLTNPPFSMDYSDSVPDEHEVLKGYELTSYGGGKRPTLRSAVMFMERYWHLLKPGGRILTVIDDGILGGKKYGYVRDYLRERFIIRAVISLHGDAFQRAGARVKTSVLYLQKKRSDADQQPSAFIYESRYIGLDDVVPKTPPSVAAAAREKAVEEIREILQAYAKFERGERGPWLVRPEQLDERIDAKFVRPWSVSEIAGAWAAAGAASIALGELVRPVEDAFSVSNDQRYTFLKVTYAGRAERGEERLGKEVTYACVYAARAGDIVVSHINAVNGAICVVPDGLQNLLVSPEFTVLRPRPEAKVDPYYIWSILRSAAVRAEFLSSSSGVGRHRVDWPLLEKQQVPLLAESQRNAVGSHFREVLAHEAAIVREQERAAEIIAALGLDGETAQDRLARAKPPK